MFPVGVKYAASGKMAQVDYHIDLTMAVVRDRITGEEVILLASPHRAFGLLEESNYEGKALLQEELAHSHILAKQKGLDVLEGSFESMGYRVEHVPNFYLDKEIREHYQLQHPNLNYTNLILGRGQVLMPEYGIPVFDGYMTSLMTSLGYHVIGMDTAPVLMKLSGGNRCALCSAD